MKAETYPGSSESLEQDISLDEVISNTHFVEDSEYLNKQLLGSYICTLICSDEELFITHPSDAKNLIPVTSSIVDINIDHNNAQVLTVFDGGNPGKPIITGIIKQIKPENVSKQTLSIHSTENNETLRFEADREIVFKCGKSSITLTRAGKVLIRGAYLLSRSSGANRIKGGSVHLN